MARSRGSIPAGLRAELARRVGVDTRALAALRIAIGLLLLADLATRAGDLVAFYTDTGVLPRSVLADRFPGLAAASLHALSGAVWYEAALFVITAAVAIALLLGFHTRVATAVSLVLLVSLHARNPVVLNAGDALLRRLLLWGVFLPLGGRWSVDAVRDGSGPPWVAGVASFALLLQVVLVYATNAAFKLRGELWRSGAAIRYVFGLDHLTVRLGDALAGFPLVLVAADRLWLALLIASPLLLLLTGRARSALVGLFVGAHLGMALTLRLGLFPVISVAALLPFLPGSVWATIASRTRRVAGLTERLAATMPRLLRRPRGEFTAAIRPVASAVAVGLLALLLSWNAAALGLVSVPPAVAGPADPADHRWDMFAPEPRTVDGWYVVPGRLASGDRVDAFHGGPVSWSRPPELAATYPSHRWFVYLLDLRRPGNAGLRPAFGDYLCRRWNAAHGDRLVAVAVYFVAEPVRLDGPPQRDRIELYRGQCPAARSH